MEKPTKRECCIFVLVTALVIFAWLCRIIDIPWRGGNNPFRVVIYPALFIWWGFTLHRRLIHPQVRRLAVSIAALIVIWFALRTVKFSLPVPFMNAARYLWYLYYLPMLFIPTLIIMMALTIGLPERKRLPGKYNTLWFIAATLFLLVITNDLHQLMFAFPDNGMVWSDHDYSYKVVYYFYAVYVAACNLAALIVLIVKSRRPKSRRWALLPCIPLFFLMVYWLIYILTGCTGWIKYWFGDLTAVSCVLYALTFELCIRCGLIRSNTGYGELFRAGRLAAQITDNRNRVRLSSGNALKLTEEQITRAGEEPFFTNKGMLLKSQPIRFGHILWQEDVSELTEAIEEFEENCRDLAEQSGIHREKLEAEKSILELQEKNRAGDLLARETADQIDLIDSLLTSYERETNEKQKRRFLAAASVVGAYIKRYGNLLLAYEMNDTSDAADLTRCFEESFISLELLGVDSLCSLSKGLVLQTKDMLHIYSTFETAIEKCLFDVRHIWVNGREKENEILINMEFVCDTDLSECAQKDDAYLFDSGTSRFTFRLRKGGVEE